jgi:TolA-binding protein
MRQKAVRFLRSVVQDEEKAGEFEGMSTRQYAAHKGIQAAENPSGQNAKIIQRSYREMAKARQATRAELLDQIEELEGEVDELQENNETLEDQLSTIAEVLGVEEEEEEAGDEDDEESD